MCPEIFSQFNGKKLSPVLLLLLATINLAVVVGNGT